MTWIREAEEAGRSQAKETAANKATFEAEEVTEEKVAAFLEHHQMPVLPLVKDLEDAGYEVERQGPSYLHHSYQRESGSEEDLSGFTLTRTIESLGWGMTDYSKWERQVYGIEWTIAKKRPDGHNPQLGTVSMYPTINERTHYAGVQYRARFDKGPPRPHVIDGQSTVGLMREIQAWIANVQAPVVVKR